MTTLVTTIAVVQECSSIIEKCEAEEEEYMVISYCGFIYKVKEHRKKNKIHIFLTVEVKTKERKAQNMDARYDSHVAVDIRDLMLALYRREGYNFSFSSLSASPSL